jgi:hypothetical protein
MLAVYQPRRSLSKNHPAAYGEKGAFQRRGILLTESNSRVITAHANQPKVDASSRPTSKAMVMQPRDARGASCLSPVQR